FTTHMNALELDLFLRIAPELYLKRLLVGGMNRVFEINRNFRNEGVSPRHNPEFTMLELYEAFGDYMTMAELTESMIRDGARMVTGDDEPRIGFGEIEIDYASPFQKAAYGDLFETHVGCSMLDEDAVRAAAEARKLKTVGKGGVPLDHWLLVGELFEAVCEDQIDPSRPTFVIDYPAALCPLTKAEAGRPEIAERFELYIAGMEIANAYTELNDPDVQAERFRAQLAGIDDEESTFRTFDEDFIRALKVGMPPAGGLGVGIDRVCMLLTGQTSIRDVILFPLLRPRA
ncbi:MAG: amino acid--tRNA ligase-related protein, partial [Planctomycetota bacterium]